MRTLALLLALVLAPQAALASVAAFPETALRGDREISAIRVGSNARQLAETRQETACFYDANASAMTDDPINHRDPTGRLVVSKKLAAKYPLAAKAILHAAELLTERIYRGLETYGGADKAQVDEVLKPNQGPVVEAAWEPEYPKLGLYPCGHFLPRQPNVINIAPDVLEAMNTGTIDDSALVATLFHELVHYLRHRNGMPVEDEEREAGKLFEQTVLGQYADCRAGPPDLKKWGLPVLTSPPWPPVPGTRRGPWTPPGTPPVLEPELRLTDTP